MRRDSKIIRKRGERAKIREGKRETEIQIERGRESDRKR